MNTFLVTSELLKFSNALAKIYRNSISCDFDVLSECETKIREYLKGLEKPSEYKICGSIIFWIRKLKPFMFDFKSNQIWNNPCFHLNELIAVLYGYRILSLCKNKMGKEFKPLHQRFLIDLAVQLRYSAFSPSSLEMLIASQYQRAN